MKNLNNVTQPTGTWLKLATKTLTECLVFKVLTANISKYRRLPSFGCFYRWLWTLNSGHLFNVFFCFFVFVTWKCVAFSEVAYTYLFNCNDFLLYCYEGNFSNRLKIKAKQTNSTAKTKICSTELAALEFSTKHYLLKMSKQIWNKQKLMGYRRTWTAQKDSTFD